MVVTDEKFKEQLPDLPKILLKKASELCSVTSIKDCFPCINTIRNYKSEYIFSDIIAGLTVALQTIPQSIAIALVAGLPPSYGLNSAYVSCFMYFLLGPSKDCVISPTTILAVMVSFYVSSYGEAIAVIVTFLSGVIILSMGLLNLGFLVRFVSVPVVNGFVSAAALSISSLQILPLLGMKSGDKNFFSIYGYLFTHLSEIKVYDAILGIGSIIGLLLLQEVKKIEFLPKTLRSYICLSRNATIMCLGICIAFLFTGEDYTGPFALASPITPKFPSFTFPSLSLMSDGVQFEFTDILRILGYSIITLPLVAVLEHTAIVKSFAKGKQVKPTQELFALGMCNLACSLTKTMPVTSSFSRTALNHASGVRTTVGCVVTGTLVLLMITCFEVKYLPKATLAAIIICAVMFLIEPGKILKIWRSKKIDFLVFLVTFIGCLVLGQDLGILLGIALNLCLILFSSAKPDIEFDKEGTSLIVSPKGHLSYSAAEHFKDTITSNIIEGSTNKIVIDGQNISSIDSTIAFVFREMMKDFEQYKCTLVLENWKAKTVGVLCRMDNKFKDLVDNKSPSA
ncbi:SLC26A11 family protein [Megaselia abdita]